MAPEGHSRSSSQTSNTRSARRWSPSRFLWAAGTLLQKRIITLQDRLGLYPYGRWIREVERPAIRNALQDGASRAAAKPEVCFVIEPGEADEAALSCTYASIARQADCSWRVALLDARLAGWAAAHPGVQVLDGAENWQSAAEQLSGEWLVPVAPGDEIAPEWSALFRLLQRSDADLIYWDEDALYTHGRRARPRFKPDWSPELLFAMNYLETAAFRQRLVCDVSRGRETAGAGWIFHAAQKARCVQHLPFVLTHRGAGASARSMDRLARHAQGAQEYLTGLGYAGARAWVTPGQALRVTWETETPLVSVIIPTKNNLGYLQRCITTLIEKTDYPDYEIILMDDRSTDPDVLAYYIDLYKAHENIRLYRNEEAFNYSRVNNQGAARAKGSLLLFLNNDVEILERGWLKEMVRWAQIPGVGMVGARLFYPDSSIQHAGIVLGLTGHAGHVYIGKTAWLESPFVPPDAYRNVSAVTGACMLVRGEVFRGLGGFDEQLGLVFNDVELGVRFARHGWRIVYTPAAGLTHYEGRSRARYIPPEDIRVGAQRLGEEIASGDQYYNSNLSLAVDWPTLKRKGEVGATARLAEIVKFKGR